MDYGPPAPVPIFQHEAEFSKLLEVYRRRRPKRVLEVGTFYGGTLYHWLQNATRGTLVVSLDRYDLVDNSHLYDEWCPSQVEYVVIRGDSNSEETALRVAEFSPFDWIFIDAGHYEHEVRRDWELYGAMCAPRGLVCFHDILEDRIHHPEIEVRPLWLELRERYRSREIVANPEAWWGGIGCIYTSSPRSLAHRI